MENRITLTQIRSIVAETLKDEELKHSFPLITISKTSFGTSIYIFDNYSKIRISDHSVSNFDRMMEESHYDLDFISKNSEQLKNIVLKHFSKAYIKLILKNGENYVNLNVRILKSELNNWKIAKIWFQEEQYLPILLDEIKNYNVVKYHDLTKGGLKRFCTVNINKYSFGVKNIVTGKIIRTRFPLCCNPDIEIPLEKTEN